MFLLQNAASIQHVRYTTSMGLFEVIQFEIIPVDQSKIFLSSIH